MSYKERLFYHIPHFLLKLIDSEEKLKSLLCKPVKVWGTFLFIDISGFTILTETLSKYGREGTEVLTLEISSFFDRALESFTKNGGDVIKFGGDALTIFFEKDKNENEEENILRAINSSLESLRKLENYRTNTPFGTFFLKAKIGLSYGEASFLILGEADLKYDYIFYGEPVDLSAEAEHYAKSGEVVSDFKTLSFIEKYCNFEKRGEKFCLIMNIRKKVKERENFLRKTDNPEIFKDFFIPLVYEQILLGEEKILSEHRPIVSCFVSFPSDFLKVENNWHLLQQYFVRVNKALKGFGGTYNRMDMGDKGSKFLCFFGAPLNFADNEERALSFSIYLKKMEKELSHIKGQSIGLDSGVAFCGIVGASKRCEYTIMGDIVNVSARLMTLASKKILVTESLRSKGREKFVFSKKTKIALKGKSHEIIVSELIRPLSKKTFEVKKEGFFVGREGELKKLKKFLNGSGHLLIIFGEAGVGKSFLIKQFMKRFTQNDVYFDLIDVPIHEQESYFVLRKILDRVSLLSFNDEFNLNLLDEILKEKREFLFLVEVFLYGKTKSEEKLKSFSEEQKKELLSTLLALYLSKIEENFRKKAVLVIENFDRVSKEEMEIISMVWERSAFKKLKFIFVMRNKKVFPFKGDELELKGFTKEEIGKFVEEYFKNSNYPSELIEFLFERTNQNPFYIKEFLAIMKEKEIVKVNKDNFIIFNPELAFSVSKSLEDILLMKIDSLGTIEKNLLKVASCFGETFNIKRLSKIFYPKMKEEEIKERLMDLSYFGVERVSEDDFKFSSTIIQETLYNSILFTNKRSLHLQIGELIESESEHERNFEILSYHFSLGENYNKAFFYSLKSAQFFYLNQQYYKAKKYYTLAYDYGKKLKQKLIEEDILNYLKSLITTYEYDKAYEIIEELKNYNSDELLLKAKYFALTILDQKGDYIKEYEEAIRLYEEAEKMVQGEIAVLSIKYAISALIRIGKYDEALNLILEGFKKLNRYNLEREISNFYVLYGSILSLKGEYSKAKETYLKAKSNAEKLNDYEAMIRAYFGLSRCHLELNEPQNALEFSEKIFELSSKIGSRLNMLGAITTIAHCYTLLGKSNEALTLMKNNLYLVNEEKYPYFSIHFFNMFAYVFYFLKDLKMSLKYFRKALNVALKIKNAQLIIGGYYNCYEILREMGQGREGIKYLIKLVEDYSSSIEPQLLKKVGAELLALSTNDKEKNRFVRILKECGKRIKNESFFEELFTLDGISGGS